MSDPTYPDYVRIVEALESALTPFQGQVSMHPVLAALSSVLAHTCMRAGMNANEAARFLQVTFLRLKDMPLKADHE